MLGGQAEGIVVSQGPSVSGCELLQLDSTPTLLCNLMHSSLRSAASVHVLNVTRRRFFFGGAD